MTSIWITAWLISVVSAAGAVFFARRSGLGWLETLLFGSVFFPAPLFVALGGGNSFIYAFDLTVPLAFGMAARRWRSIPLPAKKAAFCLFVGVGVVPLLVALTLTDRQSVLYAGISAYRLIGALAFMCILSAVAQDLEEGGAPLLGAVFWINIVLVIATLLQSHDWINSNVFYNATDDSPSDEREFLRFITAGLFRGSLGIIGTLGWVAFLAQYQTRGWRGWLGTVGGVAGALLIILCGSKTSLLALMLSTFVACVWFRWILRHLWVKLAVILTGLVVVAGVYLSQLDENYFAYTLGVLGLADESFDTFSYRQERWQEAIQVLRDDPKVLMGVATPFGPERGYAYFHNEYIGVLMSGGIWSAGAYLIGLGILARAFLRHRREAGTGRLFAILTLLASAIQGTSVNHIAPGIFFGATVLMTVCAYGIGLARVPKPSEAPPEETALEAAAAAESASLGGTHSEAA